MLLPVYARLQINSATKSRIGTSHRLRNTRRSCSTDIPATIVIISLKTNAATIAAHASGSEGAAAHANTLHGKTKVKIRPA